MKKTEPGRRNPESGFTLLEIIIAITIFGIVIATVFSSYHAIFSTTDSIRDGIAYREMAKTCLNRMITDLEAVRVSLPPEWSTPGLNDPPNPWRIEGDTTHVGDSEFSRLRFASHAHIPFDSGFKEGVAEIVYYVRETEDENGESNYVISRADNLYPYGEFEEDPADPILCENVKSLAFKYFDLENEEFETWDSESDETNYSTPSAMKIMLEMGTESSSHFFETMICFKVCRNTKK